MNICSTASAINFLLATHCFLECFFSLFVSYLVCYVAKWKVQVKKNCIVNNNKKKWKENWTVSRESKIKHASKETLRLSFCVGIIASKSIVNLINPAAVQIHKVRNEIEASERNRREKKLHKHFSNGWKWDESVGAHGKILCAHPLLLIGRVFFILLLFISFSINFPLDALFFV